MRYLNKAQINSQWGSLCLVRLPLSSFLLQKYLTYFDEIMGLNAHIKRRQTNLISVCNGPFSAICMKIKLHLIDIPHITS
jgi:hypothetical protein